MLLIHGADDRRVPVVESIQMARHLTQLGRPFRLRVPTASSHALIEHQVQVRRQLDDRFDQHLKAARWGS